MGLTSDFQLTFVLYKEGLIRGAIPNAILRRALGLSRFCKVSVLLIDCTKEFIGHTKEYVPELNVETVSQSQLHPEEYAGRIIITHVWPQTLYAVIRLFPKSFVILNVDVAPLFDRLPRYGINQPLFNRLLTFKPSLRVITSRFRRAVMSAKILFAVSDFEADILKRIYGINVDFVSPPPYDDRFFQYTPGKRDSILILGASVRENKQIIDLILESKVFPNIHRIFEINSPHASSASLYKGLEIQRVGPYDFPTVKTLYGRAAVSIIPEWRGTFELPPIESIASGVPTISPEVPSLLMVKSYHQRVGEGVLPYYNYWKLTLPESLWPKQEFFEWISMADMQRENMAENMRKLFSIEEVARRFLEELALRLKN